MSFAAQLIPGISSWDEVGISEWGNEYLTATKVICDSKVIGEFANLKREETKISGAVTYDRITERTIYGNLRRNEMKSVKIFLASSIEELGDDRLHIKAFFQDINEIYFDRGIRFRLVTCESYDNAIAKGGKQSQYDDEIRNSDLCFFLFYKKVGDYTKHEFEVALENFEKCDKPQIVTYFKYLDEAQKESEEVRKFVEMLQNELMHYYNRYDSIDALKLGIIMQIMNTGLDKNELIIENGEIKVGKMTVADCGKIPAFAANKELSGLKDKLRGLNDECSRLYELSDKNPDDDSIFAEYRDAMERRKELRGKIYNMEMKMLKTLQKIEEQKADGLTEMQKEAYRRFERGDNDGQLEILDRTEILEGMDAAETEADIAAAKLRARINELMQRIKALEIKGFTEDTTEEIDENYKIICEKTEKYNLDKRPIQEYIHFMIKQGRCDEAEKRCNRLEILYMAENANDMKYLELYNSMLLACKPSADMGKLSAIAEKMKTLLQTVDTENPQIKSYVARCYVNFSIIYRENGKKEEAGKWAKLATDIYDELSEKYQRFIVFDVASAYNAAGNYYSEMGNLEEAEKKYTKAFEILENTEEKDSADYEENISITYCNMANIFLKKGDYSSLRTAEDYYGKAIGYMEKLCRVGREKYELRLAMYLLNAATLHYSLFHPEDAAENSERAIEIYRRRGADKIPEYMKYMASGYDILAKSAKMLPGGNPEEYYLEAIKMFENIYDKNPDYAAENLAKIYYNTGCYYVSRNEENTAREYYENAYNTIKPAAKTPPEKELLAMICNAMADTFLPDKEKMLEYYGEAIEIYSKMPLVGNGIFIRKTADVYVMAGDALSRMGYKEDCEKYYDQAKALLEENMLINETLFSEGVAECLVRLMRLHRKCGDKERAKKVGTEAIAIYEKLTEKNPLAYIMAIAHIKVELEE